jgi:hypothetical protein
MRVAWLGAIAGLAASSVSAQTIGLYADAAGTDCNIVTQFQTPVTAYVVVGPGPQPISIRHINGLLLVIAGGTAGLSITATPGSAVTAATGNLFTFGMDVTVAGLCPLAGPVVLYTLTITRTAAAASTRSVRTSGAWIQCGFNPPPALHIALDTALDGVAPPPPVAPFNPIPADQATNVLTTTALVWSPQAVFVPNCWRETYRVYLGTNPDPPLIVPATSNNFVSIPDLALATTYYWRVETFLAPAGSVLAGPLWSFTTEGICPEYCETDPPACPVVCMFASAPAVPDLCFDSVDGTHTFIQSCLNFPMNSTASFDRSTGMVEAHAGSPRECTAAISDVVAADRFWLVGPAAAEPIAFTARLAFEGQNFPTGALREGAGDVAWQGGGLVEIALQHLPGSEFILRYGVRAVGDGGREPAFGFSHGELSFADLPAGYTIASCAGYGTAVPTTPASWSSMKELYR